MRVYQTILFGSISKYTLKVRFKNSFRPGPSNYTFETIGIPQRKSLFGWRNELVSDIP